MAHLCFPDILLAPRWLQLDGSLRRLGLSPVCPHLSIGFHCMSVRKSVDLAACSIAGGNARAMCFQDIVKIYAASCMVNALAYPRVEAHRLWVHEI